MPGPSVTITLFEKVTYLRGQSASNDSQGGRIRRNVLDQDDAQPSQLRGLVTVHVPKPTRIKSVELTLSGQGRTDWPEGIGSNRVELAETTQIFKEQVTLFDAKAEAAPAPPLRRANSVGPGIGLTDDVDWGLIGNIGGNGPNAQGEDGASAALSKAFLSKAKASGKSDKEVAAQLARSAGKLAAKAGTAILPPTLLREIANSRQDRQSSNKIAEGSGSGSKTNTSTKKGKTNPNSGQSQSHPTSPVSSRSPVQSRPQRITNNLPPPVYAEVDHPQAGEAEAPGSSGGSYFTTQQGQSTSSAPSTPIGTWNGYPTRHSPSPLHSPQLGPPPQHPNLPSQSISAAGPHGRSILQAPRRREDRTANGQVQTIQSASQVASEGQQAIGTDSGSSRGALLASPPRPTSREPGSSVVRFNPSNVEDSMLDSTSAVTAAAPARRRGSSASGVALPAHSTPASGTPTYRSAPTSRRPSVDLNNAEIAAGGKQNKGKGKASGDVKGKESNNKLSGLKDLLGGLRRDEANSKSLSLKDGSSNSAVAGAGRPARGQRSTEIMGSSLSSSSRASSNSSAAPSPPSSRQSPSTSNTPHKAPQYNAPQTEWREFKKGTYTYSISLPLPANLPPSIRADFGSNTYTLKAVVRRSGPLTPNLTCEKEVVLVHAPDESGTEETEAVVVERTWEDALTYRVFVSGRSFACGSTIPLWMKFIPLGEKVKIWRLTASLEEKIHYYAKQRKVARHETPRRTILLKVIDPNVKPLLPIISESTDALASSQLAQYATLAADLNVPPEMRSSVAAARGHTGSTNGESSSSPMRSRIQDDVTDDDGSEEVNSDALASLLDPAGPWELAANLELPGKDSRVNISTDHERSCIAINHSLKLTFRVERNVGGQSKLFDIVIEAPIKINHSHTAEAWLSLPNYESVAATSSLATPHAREDAREDDYFSRPQFYSGDSATAYQQQSSRGSSSGQTTPNGLSPITGRNDRAAPVPIDNAGSGRAGSSGSGSTSAFGTLPASWNGNASSGGPGPSYARSPPSTTTSRSPRNASSPLNSPPISFEPAGSAHTNANQWLALSIERDQTAGRSERMVTFAPHLANGNASGATGDELPPPYTANDSTASSSDSVTSHTLSRVGNRS
ncbi:unnamed protein product [Sympodiomycopsis kandeliae]